MLPEGRYDSGSTHIKNSYDSRYYRPVKSKSDTRPVHACFRLAPIHAGLTDALRFQQSIKRGLARADYLGHGAYRHTTVNQLSRLIQFFLAK